MCGNSGHLCPKVTHIFKNCRFYQCVNDMLFQVPVFVTKHGNSRKNYIDGTAGNSVSYYYVNDMRNVTLQMYSGWNWICDCASALRWWNM